MSDLMRPDAFAELVREYEPRILRYLAPRVGRSNAHDVAQNVFIKLLRSAERYDESRGSLTTWIMTIARNESEDWRRARNTLKRGSGRVVSLGQDPPNYRRVPDEEDRQYVRELVKRLEPKYQKVIEAVHIDEMDYAQASEKLGIPVGTVKSRAHYGRKLLREMHREEYWLDP